MWLSARAWERTSRVWTSEIALKYYLRRGGVESALRQDTQLVKALELWDGTVPVAIEE